MNTLLTLALKEYKDGIRNRWVLAITILLTLFALTLVFLGSAPVGETKASPIAITIVSLASLNIFLRRRHPGRAGWRHRRGVRRPG